MKSDLSKVSKKRNLSNEFETLSDNFIVNTKAKVIHSRKLAYKDAWGGDASGGGGGGGHWWDLPSWWDGHWGNRAVQESHLESSTATAAST